jgi:hypothetical protein
MLFRLSNGYRADRRPVISILFNPKADVRSVKRKAMIKPLAKMHQNPCCKCARGDPYSVEAGLRQCVGDGARYTRDMARCHGATPSRASYYRA